MVTRVEITRKYARDYAKASKKVRGRLLDEVVAVTGWSRDNARRRLSAAAKPSPRAVATRKPRARKFSYDDATKVLQRVWALGAGQCGKYFAVSMPGLLDALERHGELVAGKDRHSPEVRGELLAMSATTIDRYLAPAKDKDPLRGISTTKPSPLLRTSIQIRKAGDEVEAAPGFFEGDTVAHCGPSARGEYCRTLNLTDMHTGWTFTRSRPYRKNDQATNESKNNHLVRRYGFYWRYDNADALRVLNRLWPLVNDRLNYFPPTKKPIGWTTNRNGRRARIYDKPRAPFQRLLEASVLSPAQERELTEYHHSLNPADLARRIQSLQDRLTTIARRATLELEASLAKPLPDTSRNIKVNKAS